MQLFVWAQRALASNEGSVKVSKLTRILYFKGSRVRKNISKSSYEYQSRLFSLGGSEGSKNCPSHHLKAIHTIIINFMDFKTPKNVTFGVNYDNTVYSPI